MTVYNPFQISIPSQDSADNNYVQDVVGNKTDTTGGNSVVALNKINKAAIDVVDGYHDVPSQDSVANTTMRDVVGNKTDTHSGDSVYAQNKTLLEHIHKESKVYPTLANGVTVTGAAGAWTLGNFVEIVPASTITNDFDIHYISVEAISANDVYELVLYKGALASEVEIGRVRFTKTTNLEGTQNQPFQCPLQTANERISAKLASQGGGSDTVTISLFYHEY